MNSDWIEELTNLLQEVADVGGSMERTKIFPNLEVIDATPADVNLASDYIIIQDDEGYNVPALKVPGVSYADGDLVDVLFIRGAEPIAFQHGPGSPGGGGGSGGNVWPAAGENLLDGTGYATVALLIAAMVAGDIGYLGGRSSAETVDVNEADINLQGVGRLVTIFTVAFLVSAVTTRTRIEDLGVVVAGSGTAAIRTTDGPVDLVDVKAQHTGVEDARGFQLEADARLYDCEGIADSTGAGTPTARAVYVTNSAAVEIHGGNFSATTGTADEIFADAGASVLLDGPTLAFGNFGGVGDINGWYIDSVGGVHFVAYTGAVLKEWQFNSSGNLVSTANSKLFLGDGATEAPLNMTERAAEPSSPNAEDIYLDDGTNTASSSPSFRRFDGAVWEDIGGGGGSGGWPFAAILTVSATDPDADYATLPLALAAAASGDVILLDANATYDFSTTGETLATKVHIMAIGNPHDTIITCADSYTFNITAAGCTFTNLTINNTKGGGTDSDCIQGNVNDIKLYRCLLNKTGAADDAACVLAYGGTGWLINDCQLITTGATKNYALWNNTAVAAIEIIGGSLSGTTQDILSDQASTITLRGVKLVNSLISLTGGGTLVGHYINAAGNVVFVGSSVISGLDKATVSKVVASDGSPDALTADAAGYLTAGVHPLVSAFNSVTDANVTGDATDYTIIFDTEIVDRNSNYNNATGVFTAPVTGKYLFVVSILLDQIGAAHTLGFLHLVTSNRTYVTAYSNPAAIAGAGLAHFPSDIIADMDSGDTAFSRIRVSNGAKTVDAFGNASPHTYFMVYLLP